MAEAGQQTTTSTTTGQAAPLAPNATATTGGTQANWYDGAATEDIGWIQNKGFKSPLDVVQSARNLEKLMGVPHDKIIKLSDKMYDDNGKLTADGRGIYERLGAPKEAKEYNLEIPKENGDPGLADFFRNIFHERGIRKADAEALVKGWNEYAGNAQKQFVDGAQAKTKEAEAELRKEWGAAFDQNINVAKQGASQLGLDQKQIDAIHGMLGNKAAMTAFVKIGKALGEGQFIQGNKANLSMEPAAALSEIKAMMHDSDFQRRFNAGDREAISRWTRLNEMAHPGEYAIR